MNTIRNIMNHPVGVKKIDDSTDHTSCSLGRNWTAYSTFSTPAVIAITAGTMLGCYTLSRFCEANHLKKRLFNAGVATFAIVLYFILKKNVSNMAYQRLTPQQKLCSTFSQYIVKQTVLFQALSSSKSNTEEFENIEKEGLKYTLELIEQALMIDIQKYINPGRFFAAISQSCLTHDPNKTDCFICCVVVNQYQVNTSTDNETFRNRSDSNSKYRHVATVETLDKVISDEHNSLQRFVLHIKNFTILAIKKTESDDHNTNYEIIFPILDKSVKIPSISWLAKKLMDLGVSKTDKMDVIMISKT